MAATTRGRRLRLRAEGVERTRFTVAGGATFIDESASGAVADDELAHLLREYVRRLDPARLGVNEADLASTSLDSLVAAVAPFTHTRS